MKIVSIVFKNNLCVHIIVYIYIYIYHMGSFGGKMRCYTTFSLLFQYFLCSFSALLELIVYRRSCECDMLPCESVQPVRVHVRSFVSSQSDLRPYALAVEIL